jgi:nitroreductase
MLADIIKSRRNIKPAHFNGEKITDASVADILALADWAPTHKFTEPWRFVVFANERVHSFCLEHAALYKANTPEAEYEQSKFDKLLHLGDKASHIVVVYMKRTPGNRLPEWEEQAAVACAIQNMLLAAHANGIAAFWSTGGMSAKPQFKTWLDLADDDFPMGMIYLGKSDEKPVGVRRIPVEEKVRWEV